LSVLAPRLYEYDAGETNSTYYGSCPAGYTHQDLEQFLDLLYGLYSYLYTPEELCQIVVSDPFDRAEPPRSFKLVELAAWLEAILA
jgi:hypothetical protein